MYGSLDVLLNLLTLAAGVYCPSNIGRFLDKRLAASRRQLHLDSKIWPCICPSCRAQPPFIKNTRTPKTEFTWQRRIMTCALMRAARVIITKGFWSLRGPYAL
jgi:hypothetical protein